MYKYKSVPFGFVLVFLGLLVSSCTVRYVAEYNAEVKK